MGKVRRKIQSQFSSNRDKKTLLPFSTRNLHKSIDKPSSSSSSASATILSKVSSTGGSRITKKKSTKKLKLSKSKKQKQILPAVCINDADVFNQVLKSASSKIQSRLIGIDDKDKDLNTSNGGSVWKKVKTKLRTKKDRKIIKREAFHKKMELIQTAQKEQIAKSHREKTVIVRDLKPILDALDDIITVQEPSSVLKTVAKTRPSKKSNKLSMKQRQNDINQGLQYFANTGK